MKTFSKIMAFALLAFALPASLLAQYDDIYYSGDDVIIVEEHYYGDTSEEDADYVTYDEDEYDYYYSSRIRRFHRPYNGFRYYSNCYTNRHFYDPFGGWGNNIYSPSYDRFWSDFYSPHVVIHIGGSNRFHNWRYNNHYAWNPWGHHHHNHYWGNNNFYSPNWHQGYNNYNPYGSGYGNNYYTNNYYYNDGYNDGFNNGYNNNNNDDNYVSGNTSYGPRPTGNSSNQNPGVAPNNSNESNGIGNAGGKTDYVLPASNNVMEKPSTSPRPADRASTRPADTKPANSYTLPKESKETRPANDSYMLPKESKETRPANDNYMLPKESPKESKERYSAPKYDFNDQKKEKYQKEERKERKSDYNKKSKKRSKDYSKPSKSKRNSYNKSSKSRSSKSYSNSKGSSSRGSSNSRSNSSSKSGKSSPRR